MDSTVSDNCVLLQNAQNVVKGTTTTGRTVTVTFKGQQTTAVADSTGAFKVTFNPGAAESNSQTLTVSDGTETKTISNVLVGEVWLVSGQSNAYNSMDFSDYSPKLSEWMSDINYPQIRVATSQMNMPSTGYFASPSDPARGDISIPLRWEICSPANQANVQKISPLAFFFAKELHKGKNVPVGITVAGFGATWIGQWMTPEALAAAKVENGGGDPACPNSIHAPHLTRFDTVAARGAIWFQGESDANTGGAGRYKACLRALINDWRAPTHRNNSNFPVFVVGLTNYKGIGQDAQTPGLRIAQELAAASLSNVACIPAIDLAGNTLKGYGMAEHPDQKPELAARLYRAARAVVYGESSLSYRCPYPTGAYFNSDKTKVTVPFPSSVQLHKTANYTILPFRVKSGTTVVYATPTIGADNHSIELTWTGLSAAPTTASYCFLVGTESNAANIYEMKMFDQDNDPLPPFDLTISDAPIDDREAVQLWANGPYWATMNIGATTQTGSGYCFWWGDTVGYYYNGGWKKSDGSSASSYLFGSSSIPTWGKDAAALQAAGMGTAAGNLSPAYDAASVHWGGNWRMPTSAERDLLNSNCTFTWKAVNGVNGAEFRGKDAFANASIFIPAAGYAGTGGVQQPGVIAYYYTGTAYSGDNTKAGAYMFNSGSTGLSLMNNHRYNGYTIRAVCDTYQSGHTHT